MYECQKVDSIPQMCTGNGQNKKKYAGGGTVRINDSFTIRFPSISRISISWSFLIMQVGIQKKVCFFRRGKS